MSNRTKQPNFSIDDFINKMRLTFKAYKVINIKSKSLVFRRLFEIGPLDSNILNSSLIYLYASIMDLVLFDLKNSYKAKIHGETPSRKVNVEVLVKEKTGKLTHLVSKFQVDLEKSNWQSLVKARLSTLLAFDDPRNSKKIDSESSIMVYVTDNQYKPETDEAINVIIQNV